MGHDASGAPRRAPEILAATADRYRQQASDTRRDANSSPDDDGFCLTIADARELERAADLLDAVSRIFHQRSDVSVDYQLPCFSAAPVVRKSAT